MATQSIQSLWNLPTPEHTVKITVRHTCGHVERYPFEGTAESDGYHMPATEAARLRDLRATPCIHC